VNDPFERAAERALDGLMERNLDEAVNYARELEALLRLERERVERYRKALEVAAQEAAGGNRAEELRRTGMSKRVLCFYCQENEHTSPPNGSMSCECGTRTCACYGIQVRAGFRKDRSEGFDRQEPRSSGATPETVVREEGDEG
jgi:hypothetical protein